LKIAARENTITLTATGSYSPYKGVLNINNCSNITIENLCICAPPNAGSSNSEVCRGLVIQSCDSVLISSLHLTPQGVDNLGTTTNIGILAQDCMNLVTTHINISGFQGIPILFRTVAGFQISNCDIHDMKDAYLPTVTNKTNVGIQIDQLDGNPNVHSSNGRISNNHLWNLPGQGIFIVEGNHISIEENLVNNVANTQYGDGGRGIYIKKGTDICIKKNYIYGVDSYSAGGGIKAGSIWTERVLIEQNEIRFVGNDRKDQNIWNGFGISVREKCIVENNYIGHCSTYGILIQPNSKSILINENTIEDQGLSGVLVSCGYSYDGSYENEPRGPADKIIIRDNRIYRNSVGIKIQPRSELEYQGCNSFPQFNSDWNFFDVVCINNSLWNNNSVGIQILAAPISDLPSTQALYYIYYDNPDYNGQGENYCLVDASAGFPKSPYDPSFFSCDISTETFDMVEFRIEVNEIEFPRIFEVGAGLGPEGPRQNIFMVGSDWREVNFCENESVTTIGDLIKYRLMGYSCVNLPFGQCPVNISAISPLSCTDTTNYPMSLCSP